MEPLSVRQLAIPLKYLPLQRLIITQRVILALYQEQRVRLELPPVELLQLDHHLQGALGHSKGCAIDPGGPPEPVEDYPGPCAEGRQYVSFYRVDMSRDV